MGNLPTKEFIFVGILLIKSLTPEGRKIMITFAEFYAKYSTWASASMASWKKLKYCFPWFLDKWRDLPLDRITPEEVDAWRSVRLAKVSEASVNREFNAIAGLFSKAVEWKYIPFSPCSGLKRYRVTNRRFRVLTKEEALELLAMARQSSRRLYWIISTLHDTGCRPGEISTLRWENVHLESKTIVLRRTKTRQGRVLYLTDRVWKATIELPRKSSIVCDPWPERSYRKLFEHFEDLKPYDLRKNFITRALRAGVDIKSLSFSVGANPQTILNYYTAVDDKILRRIPVEATSYIREPRQLELIELE